MATKRCLPTRFFEYPDVMSLGSKDAQLILIGLVLMADDEGRELAHTSLISRKLDYNPDLIEQVLCELEANELIILYQVGRHRYYPFPPSTDGDDAHGDQKGKDLESLTTQIAAILHLPASAALHRLVQEFAQEPDLSLTGEADAAREWIDDQQRNRKGKHMSPAFFREWLKRERASIRKRRSSLSEREATGTDNRAPTSLPQNKSLAGKSLMHMEQQYQQFQVQRGQRKRGCYTMVERLPPSNVEAEAALLGSLIIDPEAIGLVADILSPGDFYRQA